MDLSEVARQLQVRWMTLNVEQRLLTCAGMYEAEKSILECLAPTHYSALDVRDFVFYHMHGMTVEECIKRVPDKIP